MSTGGLRVPDQVHPPAVPCTPLTGRLHFVGIPGYHPNGKSRLHTPPDMVHRLFHVSVVFVCFALAFNFRHRTEPFDTIKKRSTSQQTRLDTTTEKPGGGSDLNFRFLFPTNQLY